MIFNNNKKNCCLFGRKWNCPLTWKITFPTVEHNNEQCIWTAFFFGWKFKTTFFLPTKSDQIFLHKRDLKTWQLPPLGPNSMNHFLVSHSFIQPSETKILSFLISLLSLLQTQCFSDEKLFEISLYFESKFIDGAFFIRKISNHFCWLIQVKNEFFFCFHDTTTEHFFSIQIYQHYVARMTCFYLNLSIN